MNKKCKKAGFASFVIFLLLFSSTPLVSSNSVQKLDLDTLNLDTLSKDKEIHLLRVEHYLELLSEENVGIFNVKYAFPPEYFYQVPILLEIFNDTTADILNYKIENEKDMLNKVVNFTISSIGKNEPKLIHFTVWVLVENHDFSDLPASKPFPNPLTLPDDVKTWLVETNVTQKDSILIKATARVLKGFKDDLIIYAKRVAPYIKYHRFLLFLIELRFGLFFSQDARTTLLINGENVGRSHLSCALFRSQNVPARVLLVNNDQGFWTQMHYMIEYYVPDYGWVLLDTTKGETPYDTKRQVINRICFPEDENNTKKDYIFRFMKGEERWIWIDNENVRPHYVDCNQSSKSQMFSEKVLSTCELVADSCFDLTKITFAKYQQFLGLNLTGENKIYFENAVDFQKSAINNFKNDDILDYYYNIQRASEEYDKITGV
jgi:hypothetical protein